MTIKKFMGLKSKTKYTTKKKKKIVQKQKLSIVKLKKKLSPINQFFIQNKQSCPFKNSKQKLIFFLHQKKNLSG